MWLINRSAITFSISFAKKGKRKIGRKFYYIFIYYIIQCQRYYYYLGRFIRKSAKTNKETRLTKI